MKDKQALLTLLVWASTFCLLLVVSLGLDTALPLPVAAQSNGPTLTIPLNITAHSGSTVTVPIHFRRNGFGISGFVFSLDIDPACLTFSSQDENGDGQPDAVHFALPSQLRGSVSYNATDSTGELDFVVADYAPPLATLPDTDSIIAVTFATACTPLGEEEIISPIHFSQQPPPSFSDSRGNVISGLVSAGSVRIGGPRPPTTTTPTPSITATPLPSGTATTIATATVTPSATPTVTPIATVASTVTSPVTGTATATATPTAAATTTPPVITLPARIGDRVWLDRNGDGLQTVGEPPLAGITVTLYSTATIGGDGVTLRSSLTRTAVITTVTQQDGGYLFTPLTPGRYFIAFTSPAPYVPTLCNQGNDETTDSDACRVDLTGTSQTAIFTVTVPQIPADWDAGFTFPATIRGRAYLDGNRNNHRDPDEPPMPGLTIVLQEGSTVEQRERAFLRPPNVRMRLNSGNREVARTITGADGSYTFPNLTPGRYQLLLVVPVDFTAPATVLTLPWLASGELLNEDAGLFALQPTHLTEAPEPNHCCIYLPLIQNR